VIVTTITDGLGNQLFQYAVGRALAARTDRELVLDATLMPSRVHGGLRRLALDALPIPPTRTLRRPRRAGGERPPGPTTLRVRNLARRALRERVVVEPMTRDAPVDLADPPRPLAVLQGHWQSHRYFAGSEGVLRAELTPPVAADGRVAAVLDRLDGQDLIALHVRRGDYVASPAIADLLGAQPVAYTLRAAGIVAAACDRPTFAVLSDDPSWAAEHVRLDAPTVHVEAEGPLGPVEVLALMSRARHAVIANSSLSWWGAWLAEHPDQRVVTPARWFASRAIDPAHRFPPHWTVI